MAPPYVGRRRPYTQIGITRVPCSRCGAASRHQWQVCANGGRFLGLCPACDVQLNELALEFARVPGAAELMRLYRLEHGPKHEERDEFCECAECAALAASVYELGKD